jgi:hypothetical protein
MPVNLESLVRVWSAFLAMRGEFGRHASPIGALTLAQSISPPRQAGEIKSFPSGP